MPQNRDPGLDTAHLLDLLADEMTAELRAIRDESEVYSLDTNRDEAVKQYIDEVGKDGDTLGGVVAGVYEAPVIDELATECAGRVTVGKVNVDDEPALAVQYGIRSIPTLLLFKAGQVIDQAVGVVPKHVLVAKLGALA